MPVPSQVQATSPYAQSCPFSSQPSPSVGSVSGQTAAASHAQVSAWGPKAGQVQDVSP